MTCHDKAAADVAELRRRAEKQLRPGQDAGDRPLDEETSRLIHELQVHQIELEIQNEELRRAQAELDAARARYFDLYDLAPVGYCTISEKGLILEANLTAASLFGTSRGALAKAPISRFILDEDQDIYYLSRRRLFETRTAQFCELRMRKADGTPFRARLEAVVAAEAEDPLVCRLVVSDVTERVRMQQQLQTLERHDSLARMAGAVAHVFNNQLAAVIGNLELLSEDLPPGSSGFESLDEARRAALSAAETSRLMLTFLGHSPGKPVPLDLAGACRKCLAEFEPDVAMRITQAPEMPDSGPIVRIDPIQLGQVVSALVENACESLGMTGGVSVSVSTMRAADIPLEHRFPADWQPASSSYACLSVTDTGCGMEEGTIGRIFDPFYTQKFTGRGLGLTVALGIVKASLGCIVVGSKPGCGSTFRVFWALLSEAS